MAGFDDAQCVGAGDEVKGAVEFGDFIQEEGDVHRAGFGHLVVACPSAIILMPLPNIPVEGGFGVDLELNQISIYVSEYPKSFQFHTK